MRVILLGPPGSGKGTQADLIENKYHFPKVSTGDLLRRAIEEKTELGQKAEAIMKKGELVSDEIVEELVRMRIHEADCQKGYILDGFPRNIAQAQSLESMEGERQEVVFELLLSFDEITRRLSSRRICPRCMAIYNLQNQRPKVDEFCDHCGTKLILREDDSHSVIENRLRVYEQKTKILRDYYLAKGVYHGVDGARSVRTIFDDICAILEQKLSRVISRES